MRQLMCHRLSYREPQEKIYAVLKRNDFNEYFGVLQWIRNEDGKYSYDKLKIEINEYHRLCRELITNDDFDNKYIEDNNFKIVSFLENGITNISIALANNPENKIVLQLEDVKELKNSSKYFEAEIERINNRVNIFDSI